MTDRTKQILYIIGGTVGILTVAVSIGMLVFAVVNGYVTVPQVTIGNFWAFVNFLLISVLVPYLSFKMSDLQQSSRRNEYRIDETHRETRAVNHKLENGIKTKLDTLVARVPDERVAGGQRASDPPSPEDGAL